MFCEKPVALDVPGTERARSPPCAAAGVPLQIGFQRRYDPGYAEARRRIAAGEVGAVHLFRAVSHDPYPPAPAYIAGCGGQFLDMAIHDIDLARFLTGDEVVERQRPGHRARTAGAGLPRAPGLGHHGAQPALRRGALGSIVNSRQSGYGYDIHTEVLGDPGASRWGTSATCR